MLLFVQCLTATQEESQDYNPGILASEFTLFTHKKTYFCTLCTYYLFVLECLSHIQS